MVLFRCKFDLLLEMVILEIFLFKIRILLVLLAPFLGKYESFLELSKEVLFVVILNEILEERFFIINREILFEFFEFNELLKFDVKFML